MEDDRDSDALTGSKTSDKHNRIYYTRGKRGPFHNDDPGNQSGNRKGSSDNDDDDRGNKSGGRAGANGRNSKDGGEDNGHGRGGDEISSEQSTESTTSTRSATFSSSSSLSGTTTISSSSWTSTSNISTATSISSAITTSTASTTSLHAYPTSSSPLSSSTDIPSTLLQPITTSFNTAALPAAATTSDDDLGHNDHNDHKSHKSTSSNNPNTVTIVIIALAAIAFFTICATVLYYRRRARLAQRLVNRQSEFRKAELDAVDTAVRYYPGGPHEAYVVRMGFDYPVELEAVRVRAELSGSLGKRRTKYSLM
ncbi:hypothetical protein F5Y18DRAFT_280127 [Xylariaceae sp. FL1019]|nr:hypothetical protein F5Y18DRAFT_280127 [Xylariaceae sp. FL1019]